MRSYLNFLKASWNAHNHNYVQAYDYYVNSICGNYYNPKAHKLALLEISKILDLYGIDKGCLKKFKFREQEKARDNR